MHRSRGWSTVRTGVAVAIVAVLGPVTACSGNDGSTSADTGANGGSAELAAEGADLVESYSCTNCHTSDGSKSTGPTWKGIWGTEETLSDGRTVTVDEEYVRRSITDSGTDVVDGFSSIMPSFNLDADELEAITAYIASLAQ